MNIQRDIDFLSANVRNVPERHRSIRAVFDYSWRLLSPAEQHVMMRLSAFRGGWTVEEAESLAGANVLMLRALIEKSLVRVAGPGRYDLHQLIRQYAADRLDAAGQVVQARRRHSEVYLALATQLDSKLYGPRGIAAFARLDQEHDNLRAGIRWALEAGEIDIARQYITCLWTFWLRRGHWSEAEHWSKAAVGQAGEADSTLLCLTLMCAATFTALQGCYIEAGAYYERLVPMARRLEDPETIMRVLLVEGQALPEIEQVAAAFEQLFAIGKQLEVLSKGPGAKEALLAEAHFLYGDQLRFAGRSAEAAAHYRQSLELFRQLGNVDMIRIRSATWDSWRWGKGASKRPSSIVSRKVWRFRARSATGSALPTGSSSLAMRRWRWAMPRRRRCVLKRRWRSIKKWKSARLPCCTGRSRLHCANEGRSSPGQALSPREPGGISPNYTSSTANVSLSSGGRVRCTANFSSAWKRPRS